MSKLFIIFGSILSLSYCFTEKISYPIYYVEDVCAKSHNQIIKLGSHPSNSSLVIKSNSSTHSFRNCVVVIDSSNDHQIYANVKHFIKSHKSSESKSYNSITFTKLENNKRLIIEFNGFEDYNQLVVTSYKAINDDEQCPQSYFLCEKNKCIHENFRCDTYVNCENDESQIACAEDITPGNTILITIILGIVCSLLGTSCIISTCVYFKFYKRKIGLIDSKQILYGTVNASISTQDSLKIYRSNR